MISLPSGVRVWLACGHTNMRKGMNGLAVLVQHVLNEDPRGAGLERRAAGRAARR